MRALRGARRPAQPSAAARLPRPIGSPRAAGTRLAGAARTGRVSGAARRRGCRSVPPRPRERGARAARGDAAGAAPPPTPGPRPRAARVRGRRRGPRRRTKGHAGPAGAARGAREAGTAAAPLSAGGRARGAAMPWFPVKKLRKQAKLLLPLLLLTCAAWLSYGPLSLGRPGRAPRQRPGSGRGTGGAGGGGGPSSAVPVLPPLPAPRSRRGPDPPADPPALPAPSPRHRGAGRGRSRTPGDVISEEPTLPGAPLNSADGSGLEPG